jgi:hypothetical protein
MVPQDYQPVYPDFSQRGNADCSGSEQSRSDEFARMVARLRPDELAQLNEFLTTPGKFYLLISWEPEADVLHLS